MLRQNFSNRAAVRREVRRLVTTTNEQHVHQRLGFKTPMQFRRAKRFRRLPANFRLDFTQLPVTVGKILFLRWVPITGAVDILGEAVKVGRRYRYQYVKALLETKPQRLRLYCNGRLIKQCPFKLRIP